MLPVLLVWLYRKYGKRVAITFRAITVLLAGFSYFLVALVLFMLLLHKSANGQELNFSVLKGNEVIGWVNVECRDAGQVTQIKVISDINVRILFRYHAEVREEVSLQGCQIQSAFLSRKINGEEKIKRFKKINGNRIEVNESGKTVFQEPAGPLFHVLQLYLTEPSGITEVYSEKFQQAVPLKKTGPHIYVLSLPDGNENTYYYTNRACTRIRINSTFFSADIIKN